MGKDNMLGEDEDWLHELSIDMFPEDGCLRVYGVGEGGVTAFTRDGIECLQCCNQLPKSVGAGNPHASRSSPTNKLRRRAPPQVKPAK